jgi:predicted SAM-dependent methyltransferase
MPFANGTADVIVMEQVLEHLAEPGRAFREAKRVLKGNGLFCIGVPDASRYADFYFFDFYWLLLREHLQHFDIHHLKALARREGFESVGFRQTAHAVMSERMVMPNLIAIFRSSGEAGRRDDGAHDERALELRMREYVIMEQSRQSEKRRKLDALRASRRPVYVWGIGREFLYLYESAGLSKCHIAGLVDANPFKQKTCSVGGMRIREAAEVIPGAPAGSMLVLSAIAHAEAVKNAAQSLGFKGDFFDL